MNGTPDIKYDVASVLNRGHRDYQEDAIATDFPLGADFGYAVLSDGMGGHAAGDVASKIVVTEVFSELKFQSSDADGFEADVGSVLKNAAVSANECMAAHAMTNPQTAGMGATLVAPVLIRDCLFWISIGDSPLYLMRNGRLRQLNEDHSLGPHIDYMVRSGMMPEDVGRNHPDRNALTSVLIGEAIERIDCPDRPFRLKSGDILVVASDGLQFLSNAQITRIVEENAEGGSAAIAETLLEELRELDDPEQDNICFSVIKVEMKDANKDHNIFSPEFERRKSRSPRVTTRPIKPEDVPDPEEMPASVAQATNGAAKSDEGETTPIFLRRRWLATDGGA
ncbi:MAG: serine/threonine-protein phosphatase [Silicimonas sp.]|nr:serine/threonine-protein phosphatase [Silicimonas sp.]